MAGSVSTVLDQMVPNHVVINCTALDHVVLDPKPRIMCWINSSGLYGPEPHAT